MKVVRLNHQATKHVRRIRGFARNAGLGRITRAQAVALALADFADQVQAARIEGPEDLALIKAHVIGLRREGKA